MKFTTATAIKNSVSLAAVFAGLAFMYQAPAANAVLAQSQSTEVSEIIPGLEVDDHSDSRTEASTRLASQEARAAQLAQWRYEVTHIMHRLNSLRNQKAEVGAWAKVYGAEMKGKRIFSKKIKAESVEVGADKLLSGGWLTGASFSYTNIDSDFIPGSVNTHSYSIAAYASKLFASGAYVNLVARAGRLDSTVDMKYDCKGYYRNLALGVTGEVGYRKALTDTFYVMPRAGLSYSFILGDDYRTNNGVAIHQDNTESLIGRVGVVAGANFPHDKGGMYLAATLNHDFMGKSEANATLKTGLNRHLSEDLGGTWVSYGVGAKYKATDNLSFYGTVSQSRGGKYKENYRYSVAAEFRW